MINLENCILVIAAIIGTVIALKLIGKLCSSNSVETVGGIHNLMIVIFILGFSYSITVAPVNFIIEKTNLFK